MKFGTKETTPSQKLNTNSQVVQRDMTERLTDVDIEGDRKITLIK